MPIDLDNNSLTSMITAYRGMDFQFSQFLKRVLNFFSDHPTLNSGVPPCIHSIKYRTKTVEHLEEKIRRKWQDFSPMDENSLFDKITDLIGVRILHLYQGQFPAIHREILAQTETKEWLLNEPPTAYTWDPESKVFYEGLGLTCEVRETFYTSIHYVIKPREDSPIKCEIQVRTLFEEIWGEIDHSINYPSRTASVACREQLKVLARLSSAGTRLADSIFASHQEHFVLKNQ
jgi:putative GTP pyrophosphokinase